MSDLATRSVKDDILANYEKRIRAQQAEIERLRAALTPSVHTKAAYIGEFRMDFTELDEFGEERTVRVDIPWTSIKEIMRAIEKYADEQTGDGK